MKKLLIALAAVVVATVASYGQGAVGQVQFANKGTGLDAPVTIAGSNPTVGLGTSYNAQLFLADASGNATTALTPITTFRAPGTGAAAIADRYIIPVTVDVPGHAPGETLSFIMRAFNGATYDAAQNKGQSAPFSVTIGGGLNPPAPLSTLQGFTVTAVPEPSIIALGVLGAAALALRRRK